MNEKTSQSRLTQFPSGGRNHRGRNACPGQTGQGRRDHSLRHGVRASNEGRALDLAGQLRGLTVIVIGGIRGIDSESKTEDRSSIRDVLNELAIACRRLACANLRAVWAIQEMERKIFSQRSDQRAIRRNARADLPRIDDVARESGCEGNNRG